MKKFTLQQIAEMIYDKNYLTRERFLHYFPAMYGFDRNKTYEYWKVYEEFPRNICNEKYFDIIEDLIEKAGEVLTIIKNDSIS